MYRPLRNMTSQLYSIEYLATELTEGCRVAYHRYWDTVLSIAEIVGLLAMQTIIYFFQENSIKVTE